MRSRDGAAAIVFFSLISGVALEGLKPSNSGLLAFSLVLMCAGLATIALSRKLSNDLRIKAEQLLLVDVQMMEGVKVVGQGSETTASDAKDAASSSACWQYTIMFLCTFTAAALFVFVIQQIQRMSPTNGVAFIWSFGTGVLLAALCAPIAFIGIHRRKPCVADLGRRRDLLLGVSSGCMWCAGFTCLAVALDNGLDPVLADSIFIPGSLIISGAWAVAFKELSGRTPISLFAAGSSLVLCSVVLEKLSTQ